ncbi:hypothetical protein B0H13DRAFT_268522 [Mycena leptocephala]|nr:hypothetical protein B0H13DRAFT_268522 [Mycena leptocephala]
MPTFRAAHRHQTFIALDLLVPNPPVHLYRHDLESFLYVLVFLTCQIESSLLAGWKHLGMKDLYTKKIIFLTNTGALFEGSICGRHFQTWQPHNQSITGNVGSFPTAAIRRCDPWWCGDFRLRLFWRCR